MAPHRPLALLAQIAQIAKISALALIALLASACADDPPAPPPYQPRPLGVLEQGGPERFKGVNKLVSILEVEPDTFEAGRVAEDARVEATFTVTNPTDRPIRIEAMKADCACSIPELRSAGERVELPFTVPPGGSLEVPIVVDPSGRAGRFDTSVQLTSDQHPTRPFTWLHVGMHVVPDLAVTPVFTFFGVVSRGTPQTRDVLVRARDPEVRVTGLSTSAPWLQAEIVERLPPEGERLNTTRIRVTLAADAPEGDLQGTVRIDTTHKHYPTREVTIKALVQGPVTVSPRRLTFHHVARRKGETDRPARVLILRARSGKITVRDARVEPTWITCRVLPRSGEREVSLRLEVGEPPADAPALVKGRVTIRTDHPTRPEVEVPIQVRFQQSPGRSTSGGR